MLPGRCTTYAWSPRRTQRLTLTESKHPPPVAASPCPLSCQASAAPEVQVVTYGVKVFSGMTERRGKGEDGDALSLLNDTDGSVPRSKTRLRGASVEQSRMHAQAAAAPEGSARASGRSEQSSSAEVPRAALSVWGAGLRR